MNDDGHRAGEALPSEWNATDALDNFDEGVGDQQRQRVLFATTAVATSLCVAFWLIGAGKDLDSGERIIIPGLSLLFGVLTLLAWKGLVRGAEFGLVFVGAAVLVERIWFTRHLGLEPYS